MERFFTDKQGKVVLFQSPNIPLVVWFICTLLTYILPVGELSRIVGYIGFAALIVWCLLEVVKGVSPFRRVLGLVILVLAVGNRF